MNSAGRVGIGLGGPTGRDCYLAGQRGALCDGQTRSELEQIGEAFDWAGIGA
jgi:hypothetical protein